jgi:heme oxygenase
MAHLRVAAHATTLTSLLRDATAVLCDDRTLLAGRVSWLDYRLYLARMYGFHASIERALASSRQLAAIVADAGLRNHKTALLAHDLVALGIDRRDLADLPRMPFAGSLALPEALGWTYIVESLTLNGKQLSRHLARQLPSELMTASAYLGCYGDEVAERWRQLGAALDSFEHAERDGDRVIAAASEGLLRMRSWLHPVLPSRATPIHA